MELLVREDKKNLIYEKNKDTNIKEFGEPVSIDEILHICDESNDNMHNKCSVEGQLMYDYYHTNNLEENKGCFEWIEKYGELFGILWDKQNIRDKEEIKKLLYTN